MDSVVPELDLVSCSEITEQSICRLCASRSRQTVNVFDEEVEPLDLINTIRQCLRIKISPNDVLPKDVCLPCCKKLQEYFEFYTLCLLSQKSLTELFHVDNPPLLKTSVPNGPEVGQPIGNQAMLFPSSDGPSKGAKEKCWRKCKKPLKSQRPSENEEQLSELIQNGGDGDAENTNSPSGVLAIKNVPTGRNIFENYVWECTVCGEIYVSLKDLRAHNQEVHQQLPNFKCTKCGKMYDRYRSFVRHVKFHEEPNRFTCDTCGKKFSQKSTLKSHMSVHTEERPHVCPQCGKAFKQFSSLYLHSRSHLPDQARPKFHCPVCKKALSSKHSMEDHLKIHSREKNYFCEACGKGFITKSSLNYHIKSHNEDKSHTCTICLRSFRTAGQLVKHSSLHTGVKPHQCEVCGKQFRERSGLKEHLRIHTGEMPYVCEYCGKSFRFKGILTGHIRQHTGERPYRCADCSRSFTNWANYNKHLRRRHSQLLDPSSPPSVSLPSIDFCDPNDVPLSADALNIQDFVVDHEIFRIPS